MNATETDVTVDLDLSATLQCEIVGIFLSSHDFKLTSYGEQCQNPAEFVGDLHRPTAHDRQAAHMCGMHKDRFLGAVCVNPVCGAPRLTDVRPI